MNFRSPWLSLILLGALTLTLALGVGGSVETVGVPRDDAALRGFEETLQAELERLGQL
jgi:hypothetical protein